MMSIIAKSIVALGFVEGIAGVFASALAGDPSPGVAGTQLGAMTIVAGILMEASEQKPAVEPAQVQKPS